MNRRDFVKGAVAGGGGGMFGSYIAGSTVADRVPPDPRQKGLDPGWIFLTSEMGSTIVIRRAAIECFAPEENGTVVVTSHSEWHVKESYGEILRKLNIFS